MQVEVGATEDTFALHQRLSEMVWNNLAPKLSDLFDQYVGEDEILRLDKVELDLGHIDLNSSDNDSIVEKILQLSEAKLRQYKPGITSRPRTRLMGSSQPLAVQSARDYMFQLWLFWLEYGVLPSYALRPDDNWMTQVLETLAMEQRAVSALKDTLTEIKHALKRLILQHQEKDLKSIVELYSGYSQKDLLVFLEELRIYVEQNAPRLKLNLRELEIRCWELILQKVLIQSRKMNSKELEQMVLTALPKKLVQNMEEITESKAEIYPHLSQAIKLMWKRSGRGKKLSPSTGEEALNVPVEERVDGNRIPSDQENSMVIKKESLSQFNKVPEDGRSEENRIIEEMESPQFFKNAGMVLLHPFLHRFFQKLELVEDRQFKDFYSQSKAVMLLHFLATGIDQLPEYELLLPKFLCGMTANLPMDHSILLTKREKEEANNLLEAVIENWGVLGNTSPDGLREGFLIRDGKLLKTDSGWKLIIEPKTIDILLDRLPWGISMIKLPWMEELLKVEWR